MTAGVVALGSSCPVAPSGKRASQGRGSRRCSGLEVVRLEDRPLCGMDETTVGASAVARDASCAFIAALFPRPRAGEEIFRAAAPPHSGHGTSEGTSDMGNIWSTGAHRPAQRKL